MRNVRAAIVQGIHFSLIDIKTGHGNFVLCYRAVPKAVPRSREPMIRPELYTASMLVFKSVKSEGAIS